MAGVLRPGRCCQQQMSPSSGCLSSREMVRVAGNGLDVSSGCFWVVSVRSVPRLGRSSMGEVKCSKTNVKVASLVPQLLDVSIADDDTRVEADSSTSRVCAC